MLADGFATRRGRRGAYLHHDAVNGRPAGAPGRAPGGDHLGRRDPRHRRLPRHPASRPATLVGTLNEDFAIESLPGDIFQLGNASWRILQGRAGAGAGGGRPGAAADHPVLARRGAGAHRGAVGRGVAAARGGRRRRVERRRAAGRPWRWLSRGPRACRRPRRRRSSTTWPPPRAALGVMPTQDTLVVERFFDEAGDMHLVLHAPFGSRLNRAWGLALRKRFCRTFNFELQAAATEDAIVLSLGPTHSFPLEDVFRFLHSATVRDVLIQAMLDAPLFGVRWRWNAGRALALPRFRGGRRVPPPLQRQAGRGPDRRGLPRPARLPGEHRRRARDPRPSAGRADRPRLPERGDGRRGPRARCCARIEARRGRAGRARPDRAVAARPRDPQRAEPTPSSTTRRSRSAAPRRCIARRWLDPETAADLGALDAEAIERVREEAWPEARDAGRAARRAADARLRDRRGGAARRLASRSSTQLAGATRRADGAAASGGGPAACGSRPSGWPQLPARSIPAGRRWQPGDRRCPRRLRRASLDAGGGAGRARARPAGRARAGDRRGARRARSACAARAVERRSRRSRARASSCAAGSRPGCAGEEWCERRLLARIHRYTLDRLRREIEPVSPGRLPALPPRLAAGRPGRAGRGAGEPGGAARAARRLRGRGRGLGGRDPAGADEGVRPGLARRALPLRPLRLGPAPRAAGDSAAAGAPARCAPRRSRCSAARSLRALARDRAAARSRRRSTSRPDARAVRDFLRDRGRLASSARSPPAPASSTPRSRWRWPSWSPGVWSPRTASPACARCWCRPHKRPPVGPRRGAPQRSVALFGMENAGRWSLLLQRRCAGGAGRPVARGRRDRRLDAPAPLRRGLPPAARARDPAAALARAAARLPPAGGARRDPRRPLRGRLLRRAVRPARSGGPAARARARSRSTGTLVSVSAADPLNLVGIATPGDRLRRPRRQPPALPRRRADRRPRRPRAPLPGGPRPRRPLAGAERPGPAQRGAEAQGVSGAVGVGGR